MAVAVWAFPPSVEHALIDAFTYGNGFDPNSVQVAVRSVAWVDETNGNAGGIDNGQSSGVPLPGSVEVTIKCVVLTTSKAAGEAVLPGERC